MARTHRLAFLLLATVAVAQPVFQKRWHWSVGDAGRSVAEAVDGTCVLSAETRSGTADYGMLLARADPFGDTTWVRRIQNLSSGSGFSCITADNGAVLAGRNEAAHVLARKYDLLGDSLWSYASAWRSRISAVIPTRDSGCLIVGMIPDSMYDFGAIKLDARGQQQWARYYEASGLYQTWARGAVQTRDAGFILCGDGFDYDGAYARLVKTGPDGTLAWSRLYLGLTGIALSSVKETPDGGFFAVGLDIDTVARQRAVYLLKTDSSGAVVSIRHLVPPSLDVQAPALCATEDGYVVAAGIDWDDSARVWLVKTDFAGDTVWTRILGGPGRETPADIVQTLDGGYAVTGTSDWLTGSVFLFKTDSLGRLYTDIAEGPRPHIRDAGLSLSPNPAAGMTRIAASLAGTGRAGIRLYDAAGELVRSLPLEAGARTRESFEVDLAGLTPGTYMVRLERGSAVSTGKLVIK